MVSDGVGRLDRLGVSFIGRRRGNGEANGSVSSLGRLEARNESAVLSSGRAVCGGVNSVFCGLQHHNQGSATVMYGALF